MEIQFEGDGFQPPRHGLIMLLFLIGIFFTIFLLRIWYLQILQGDKYERLARNNRYRENSIYASRGFIYDSKGVLLAGNKAAYALSIVREDVQNIQKTLEQISVWTNVPLKEIELRYKRGIKSSKTFQPIILISDMPFEQVARIEALSYAFPGVRILTRPRRFYPKIKIFSHILGYVAEANDTELDKDPTLIVGDFIGKQGLELRLESTLRGKRGISQREVDASGRILIEKVVEKPSSGEGVYLSIDNDLQQKAWDLVEGKRATILVMEPYTGKIRTLVSRPAYDNNLFTKRLLMKDWVLIRDDTRNPLHNKAVQGAYPPASIWKIPMATMILENGIDPLETVTCNGSIKVGNQVFRCWKKEGHGIVNLKRAMVVSCDVYFYELGERLGIQYLSTEAKKYGFGSKLGLSLPYENAGIIPSPEWKKRRFNRSWQKGETTNFSIGQGYTLVTPVQIASFLSGIINGGTEILPSFLAKEKPTILRELDIREEYRAAVLNWMVETVDSSEGTARGLRTKNVIVGGKTGTAQVTKLKIVDGKRVKTEDLPEKFRDHAWVASFASNGDVTYVIVVLVEHGGGGGRVAVPLAKQMIDYLFSSEQLNNN